MGGAKLSRGLTLEGLSVSYYQRSTKMYDTLMQMGRWFGYRPNYLDLCRIYTSPQVADWYRYISIATRELLDEFAVMQGLNRTPKDFGLRVRHSPGMMVTARTKMQHAKLLRLSFAGARPETTSFEIRPIRRSVSVGLLSVLLTDLKEASGEGQRTKSSDYLWGDVPAETIVVYFRSLEREQLYSDLRSGSPGPIANLHRGTEPEQARRIGQVDSAPQVEFAGRESVFHMRPEGGTVIQDPQWVATISIPTR